MLIFISFFKLTMGSLKSSHSLQSKEEGSLFMGLMIEKTFLPFFTSKVLPFSSLNKIKYKLFGN